MRALPRNPDELACLEALLTPEIWTMLQHVTNSHTAAALSRSELSRARSYRPTTVDELKGVLFTRLDIYLRRLPTIAAAFEEVIFLFVFSFPT